jgi:26S proteasome regulatory subunit N10
LKHRQSKNHKPRIIIFIGSPVNCDHSELIKLSKRLKKEKVSVDIINFGEEEGNSAMLNEMINTINGKDGTSSHLVSVAAPANLSDALFSSPMFQSEDGSSLPAGFGPGYQYGMDDDPELAMVFFQNSFIISFKKKEESILKLKQKGFTYFNGRVTIKTRS